MTKCSKADWLDPKVNFDITGKDGPAAILVHGIPSSLDEWDSLVPGLVASGYRAISLDLLGHGNSYKPENPHCYTVEIAYDYFEEWVNSLKLDAPIVLIGHSFGGNLCIRYALNHPGKVRALILINPFLSYSQIWSIPRFLLSNPAPAALLMKLIPAWLVKVYVWLGSLRMEKFQIISSLSRDELINMADGYKKCSPNVVYFLRSVSDQKINYTGITMPALLIWGENDPTLSTSWYSDIITRLPDCTHHVLNSGHYPHRSKDHEVNTLILEFLKSKYSPRKNTS